VHIVQAIHGVGIDWTFAGEAVEYGGFMVRATAVLVSVGGMLVTALMLGIVSGTVPSASLARALSAPSALGVLSALAQVTLNHATSHEWRRQRRSSRTMICHHVHCV
jgi:hypothetical protein